MRAFSWFIKDIMAVQKQMHIIESFMMTPEFICAFVCVCVANPAKYYVTFIYQQLLHAFYKS